MQPPRNPSDPTHGAAAYPKRTKPLQHDGEMGERMRAFHWSSHALGPMEHWPAALASTLSIVISARFPMAIYWGDEGWLFYNDAWRPILGDKHPWALGKASREVWPEIWDAIAPDFDIVRITGQGTWRGDSLLPMQRFGYTEECYFDYTFNPIRGRSGAVEGILNVVQETTERVLSSRRTQLLRALAARTAVAKNAYAACEAAIAAFATDVADFPFTLLYLLDHGQQVARLAASDGVASSSPAHAPEISLIESPGWPLADALSVGRPIEIGDLVHRFGAAFRTPWPEPVTKALVIPIAGPGGEGSAAVLIAGINARRSLDSDYRRFLELVESHLATAIATARSYDAERRRAEQLAELDRAKTAFFNNVSHEFRTPLTLMLGPLEGLLERAAHAPALVEFGEIDVVHRNSLRLLKLVNTLLDFSRLEAGRVQANLVETNLDRLTADLASVFRDAMEKAGLRFVVDCLPLPQPVFVDPDLWEKVVFNLLSNALKFTLSGEVRVEMRADCHHAVLTVKDTGVGIAPTALPHIFQRFHRIENVHSRTHEGTGIGLALVHELVKLQGGEITVESQPGKGTAFAVRVPFGKQNFSADRLGSANGEGRSVLRAPSFVMEALSWLPVEARGHQHASTRGANGTSAGPVDNNSGHGLAVGARVLVAEDNADMRDYVRRLLAAHYQVEAVADGAAALEAARREPPDLILSDVMMPGMDGFTLAQRIRTEERLRTIPILLLSARAGEEARIEGASQSADDYLTKPFSARELLARVALHLRLARARKDNAEAAERQQLFIERVVHATPDIIFVYDLGAKRQLYLNRAVEESLGYSQAQILAMENPTAVLIHPDDQESHQKFIAGFNAARDGELRECEHRVRAANGTYRWILTRAGVFARNADGRPREIIGVATDITKRRQAEDIARESEARFRNVADNAPVMIWVTEADGSCSYLSKSWYDFTGQIPATGLGFGWLDVTHPEDRAGAEAIFADANARRAPFRLDYRLRRQDGVYRWAIDSAAPRFASTGEFLGYVGSVIDLTERKQMEERLRESEASLAAEAKALREAQLRFEIVKDGAQVGFWFCDLPFGELVWDHRVKEHFWLPPEAPVTINTFYERIHPDDREPTRLAIETSIANKTRYEIDYRTVSPQGKVKWIRALGRGFYDDRGQPHRFDGVTLDITERKRIENDLREAHALLTDKATHLEALVQERTARLREIIGELEAFSYSIAHDMRAPLRSLQGFSDALSSDYADKLDIEGQVYLRRIARSAERMDKLIQDVLSYSRVVRGEWPLEAVDLAQLLQGIADTYPSLAPEKADILLEDSIPPVLGSEAMLMQVFSNLLGNAVKFVPAGTRPTIRVWAEPRGDRVRIFVKDNGIGIAPEEHQKIFGIFHQATKGYEGTGIGLAIVKKAAERMNGTVGLESRVGEGTTFWVEFQRVTPS